MFCVSITNDWKSIFFIWYSVCVLLQGLSCLMSTLNMTENVNNEVRVCTNNQPETKAQTWHSVSVSSSVYCFIGHHLHVYHHQGAMSKICGTTGLWSTHACAVSGPSTSQRGRTKVKMYFSKQWKPSAMAITCAWHVTFLNTDCFLSRLPLLVNSPVTPFPAKGWLQTKKCILYFV